MRFFLIASGVASRRPKSGIEAVKGKRFPIERFACHIAWERKDVCTFRSFYAIIAAKRQKYLLPIRAVLPGPWPEAQNMPLSPRGPGRAKEETPS